MHDVLVALLLFLVLVFIAWAVDSYEGRDRWR